jgi:hypothetical protein
LVESWDAESEDVDLWTWGGGGQLHL